MLDKKIYRCPICNKLYNIKEITEFFINKDHICKFCIKEIMEVV